MWTGSICPTYVGIGTSNPIHNLEINGDFFVGNSLASAMFSASDGFKIKSNSSGNGPFNILNEDGLTNIFRVNKFGGTTINFTGNLGVPFKVINDNNSFKIDNNGSLNLNTGMEFTNIPVLSISNQTEWYTENIFKLNANGSMELRLIEPNGTNYFPFKVTRGTFISGDEEFDLMAIDNNGRIFSRAVTVKNTSFWPDFVFDKSYQLMPLKSLGEYIAANGHLPEIPAESYVEENGVDLYELNRLLLMKVEELTLYLLQQSQQIELLEKQMELLKK